MTSLDISEFSILLEYFEIRCNDYFMRYTYRGKLRKHLMFKEPKTSTLFGSEMKLFFLLTYMKNYPLQQFQASYFVLSQSKVSEWIKILTPILQMSLKDMGLLPSMDANTLKLELEKYQIKEVNMDATEREINRSSDYSTQKEFYSGKKKKHTVKNNLIAEPSQYILYLSQTYEGCVHDKKICDIEQYQFPDNLLLRYDLGYLGYIPENTRIEVPHKKTKRNPLSDKMKAENKEISTKRVSIEQAISGVKRLKIVADKIRIFNREFRHQVMIIAAAIHNLRVRSNKRAYTCGRISLNFHP